MSGRDANLRAAALMTGAMALFAVEDVFLKHLAGTLPVGQALALSSAIATLIVWALVRARGLRLWTRDLLHPWVMVRNLAEGTCSVLFLAALALGDMATASGILQALPLAITLAGALFLGERVGLRRWLSILAGALGVALMVRPGTAAFQPASLLAVAAVVLLALRDLATRKVPVTIPSARLTAASFAAMVPAGLLWLGVEARPPVWPGTAQMALALGAVAFGLSAYVLMVAAMRIGTLPVVAPFRYSRLVFALILAVTVFGERPDALTLAGAAIIAAAGLAALWGEARAPLAPPSRTPRAPV